MNHKDDGFSHDATLEAQTLPLDKPEPSQNPTLKSSKSIPLATVLPQPQTRRSMPSIAADAGLRYEEQGVLGVGGLGEVVAAHDHDIMRTVAIKRMLPDAQGPVAVDRFVDEIRTVGRLEHPNIVPIHDVGKDESDQYYFVMKYVRGETLETIIEKLASGDAQYHRTYSFERRTKIFIAILEALAYAHDQGIIHRDIKPANIMIGQFGEVMVMDWGIARNLDDAGDEPVDPGADDSSSQRLASTGAGALIGTPAYMSPEQARGETLDVRSDIYSLCAMFHEMLCLKHYLADHDTLEGLLEGAQNTEHTHPSFVDGAPQSKCPADLGWFVMGGLHKDPKQRYPNIGAMLARLQQRADGTIPVQCPITFTKTVTNVWTRSLDAHPGLMLAVAVLGLVSVFGAATTGVVLGVTMLLT